MSRSTFDISVYLVTDSTMLPDGLTVEDQVERAIEAGVTCVQLREKDIETKDFIERALRLKVLTDKAGIPLIIDDRLDVAQAVGAHLHIGQKDMDCKTARKLMGPDAIIGVSVSTPEETLKAIEDGADYVGIGICFDTNTKVTKKIPMGPRGAQRILKTIVDAKSDLKTCLIGGIKETNIQRVKYQSGIPERKLDGVAVVSAIMAAPDAKQAAGNLVKLWNAKPVMAEGIVGESAGLTPASLVRSVVTTKPIVHHVTNGVVKNFSANVTLAVGGSPIMSECREEIDDLARISNALVLNTGTLSIGSFDLYIDAVHAYNKYNKPIIYDPVACGATTYRGEICKKLLVEGYMTVIKGNQDEIMTAAGISGIQQAGVDSAGTLPIGKVAEVAKKFALSARAVVVVTGKTDIVADGILNGETDLVDSDVASQRVEFIDGGDPMMGSITGTGCSLGSVIGCFVGAKANRADPFAATVAACRIYKSAGEVSGQLAGFRGPGSFQYLFLDALHRETLGKELDLPDEEME